MLRATDGTIFRTRSLFCSWGDYDRKQFLQDCEHHQVGYPFLSGHLNLKAEFSRSLNLKKKLGIVGALRRIGLQFEGSHLEAWTTPAISPGLCGGLLGARECVAVGLREGAWKTKIGRHLTVCGRCVETAAQWE